MINRVFRQPEAFKLFGPLINTIGKVYSKSGTVLVRPAVTGEIIHTITSSGYETKNKALAGDFVVTNATKAQEKYILAAEKLNTRYQLIQTLADGQGLYRAKGNIRAIRITDRVLKTLQLNSPFYIMAAWGESMIVYKGDYIARPDDGDEIYRVGQEEFKQTYSRSHQL
jgi:hypothetical protein